MCFWKECWQFFNKMLKLGVGQDNKNVVAVSFHNFKEHEPSHRKVNEKNVSANESPACVLDLLSKRKK